MNQTQSTLPLDLRRCEEQHCNIGKCATSAAAHQQEDSGASASDTTAAALRLCTPSPDSAAIQSESCSPVRSSRASSVQSAATCVSHSAPGQSGGVQLHEQGSACMPPYPQQHTQESAPSNDVQQQPQLRLLLEQLHALQQSAVKHQQPHLQQQQHHHAQLPPLPPVPRRAAVHHQQQQHRPHALQAADTHQHWQQQQQQHGARSHQQQQQHLDVLEHVRQRLHLQQLTSLPLPLRPWGWWRDAGGAGLQGGLDAVRPSLLALHTRSAGDSSSSPSSSAWQQHAAGDAASLQQQRACAVSSGQASGSSADAKPPKRPWQPKMAPDEPTWNQAAYMRLQYLPCCQAGPPSGAPVAVWARSLPEHSTATFAQLMLLHSAGWPNHRLWQAWQAAHPPGSLALFVHMKAGVKLTPAMPGAALIARHKLVGAVDACWGDVSLVEAQLVAMAEILQRCPHVAHIGLASGHDVPVQLIQPGLLLPGVSLFGLYQFGAPEMTILREASVEELQENSCLTQAEAQAWGDALTFHHQWMVLSREHAAALVHHRHEIIMVGRLLHRACEAVQAGMAPDEFIVLTALKQMGYARSVQRVEVKPHMRYPPGCMLNSYPTFVVFPAESSPHPVLWTTLDDCAQCQVETNTGEQYTTALSLNDCLDLAVERSALFFRKVAISPCAPQLEARLLSNLQEMWQGLRKGSSAALKGGKASSGSSSRQRRGKRKQHSRSVTPDTSADADDSADVSGASGTSQCRKTRVLEASGC